MVLKPQHLCHACLWDPQLTLVMRKPVCSAWGHWPSAMQTRTAAWTTCGHQALRGPSAEETEFPVVLRIRETSCVCGTTSGVKLLFQDVDFMESKYKSGISDKNLVSELR